MDEAISLISTKRARGSVTHYVRVPNEWAERMEREGKHYVTVAAYRTGTDALVLTPLSDTLVEEYRLQKRREARREYQRKRYRERSSGG